MKARYHRVPTIYWTLARTWDDRLRNLGLYVQTCEHRTGEGLYRLPLAYVGADLAWPAGVPAKQMRLLVKKGFVHYDERAEVVFLPSALEIQAPTTKNQIDGAIRKLRLLPPTSLFVDFYSHALTHSNGLAESIRMEMADALRWASECDPDFHFNGKGNPFEFPSPIPSPTTEG